LSFDLNENLNQDEGDADEEMYDEEVVMAEGKVELVSQVFDAKWTCSLGTIPLLIFAIVNRAVAKVYLCKNNLGV